MRIRKHTLKMALLLCGSASAAGLKVQNKEIKKVTPHIETTVAYPHTGQAKIDAVLARWAQKNAADFKDDEAGLDLQMSKEELEAQRYPWTLDIGYEVVRNDAQQFSVRFDIDDYAGGAHPNHGFTTFNFLLPEGEPLDLEQVLDGRNGLRRLSALVMADLKRQLLPDGPTDAAWIGRGAGPEWENFQDFVLLPTVLRIEFAPYAVAAYVAGPQQVDIPLRQLAAVLRKDPRVPIPSFDCAKASTPIEQAICANRALATLDRTTNQAYRRALSGDARHNADVKQAQRVWLQQRDTRCGPLQAEAMNACLSGSYQVRLKGLVRE
jgi:uncharacterized protein YecT (DUF1311 family)